MSEDNKSKIDQKSESWSFEVDQQKIRENHRKREVEENRAANRNQRLKNQKIILEEASKGVDPAIDFKKQEEQEALKDKKRILANQNAKERAPYFKRLIAYLIDYAGIILLLFAFVMTPFTQFLLDQNKIYSGIDIKQSVYAYTREGVNLSYAGKLEWGQSIHALCAEKISKLGEEKAIGLAVFIVLYLLFFIFPVMIWGKSPGKKIMNLHIVRIDTYKNPGMKGLVREIIGKNLLIWGFFFAFFNKKRQTLHDLIFKTMVIRYDDRLFNPDKKDNMWWK